jgi:hypothetical protein
MPAVETRIATRIWKVPLIRIEQVVSLHLGPGRVRGNERRQCFSRQVSMYLAWHVGGWSTTRVGRFYSGRHHTTVLHAVSKIERLRLEDEALDALLEVLTESLSSEMTKASSEVPQLNWRRPFIDCVTDRILERIDERTDAPRIGDIRYPLGVEVGTDMAVTLTLEIPRDLAALLATTERDLSRTALEALAVEEYRARRLSDAQFRRLLNISRFEADRI